MCDPLFVIGEAVGPGHPDKVCDQLADALVDYILNLDPTASVSVDAVVSDHNLLFIGEIASRVRVTVNILREITMNFLHNLSYDGEPFWVPKQVESYITHLDPKLITVSPSQGVSLGYACQDNNHSLFPAAQYYANRLMQLLCQEEYGLGPDGKCQVILAPTSGVARAIEAIYVTIQHPSAVSLEEVTSRVNAAALSLFPLVWWTSESRLVVNPRGPKVRGGPYGDSGMTGRKVTLDAYGVVLPHGGGAFSGKDPTHLDRCGSYMARYLAKNCVAAGWGNECRVTLLYHNDTMLPRIVDIQVDHKHLPSHSIQELKKIVDFRVKGIIDHLNLRRPIYQPTACYGHFGRAENEGFPWEKTTLVPTLKALWHGED